MCPTTKAVSLRTKGTLDSRLPWPQSTCTTTHSSSAAFLLNILEVLVATNNCSPTLQSQLQPCPVPPASSSLAGEAAEQEADSPLLPPALSQEQSSALVTHPFPWGADAASSLSSEDPRETGAGLCLAGKPGASRGCQGPAWPRRRQGCRQYTWRGALTGFSVWLEHDFQ